MPDSSTKEELKQLIADGKTGKAIDKLLILAKAGNDQEYYDEVVSLSSRYQKHNEQQRKGLNSLEEQNISLNKINKALLKLIELLPEQEQEQKKKPFFINLIIGIVSILIVLFFYFKTCHVIPEKNGPSDLDHNGKEYNPTEQDSSIPTHQPPEIKNDPPSQGSSSPEDTGTIQPPPKLLASLALRKDKIDLKEIYTNGIKKFRFELDNNSEIMAEGVRVNSFPENIKMIEDNDFTIAPKSSKTINFEFVAAKDTATIDEIIKITGTNISENQLEFYVVGNIIEELVEVNCYGLEPGLVVIFNNEAMPNPFTVDETGRLKYIFPKKLINEVVDVHIIYDDTTDLKRIKTLRSTCITIPPNPNNH